MATPAHFYAVLDLTSEPTVHAFAEAFRTSRCTTVTPVVRGDGTWGKWGLGNFENRPLRLAGNKALGQVGSRIAVIPKRRYIEVYFLVGQKEPSFDSPPYDSRARKPHLPHYLLKSAVFLMFFEIVGQVGPEFAKPHLPHSPCSYP
jgi:hypothetical protein